MSNWSDATFPREAVILARLLMIEWYRLHGEFPTAAQLIEAMKAPGK